jgi:tetrahydromethanopterin S-methyltransferase subunit A
MISRAAWPVIAGTYQVGDPQAPVAVCALTSEHLIAPLVRLPGVAIVGKVYTANLGIARIVANVTANPTIRFLLLCGKDSPPFRPGQSLVALAEAGLDEQRQIIGAVGYEPVLPAPAAERVPQFRRQVEVIDWIGEEDLPALEQGIGGLAARSPGRFAAGEESAGMATFDEQFTAIRPGGQREPLQYDPKGYFVITLDREDELIILRHYLPDHTPAHEMRGRVAGSMLLGLLREGLVTQLSHAGYLGEELAKAESALRFDLRYDQDRPLRRRETPPEPTELAEEAPPPQASQEQSAAPPPASDAPPPTARMPRMPPISPSATWAQLQTTAPGMAVNVVLTVTELLAPDLLGGLFLEADEAEPFNAFRRTPHQIHILWTSSTPIAMGGPADLQVGALVRAHGELAQGHLVEAQRLVILTRVARIIEG